jgi:outer membrane biosynthesis protein TonB
MATSGVPVKAEDLVVERTGNEMLVYNPADETAHALNAAAAAVFDACDAERSIDDITSLLVETLDTPVDDEIVALAIKDLTDAGLVTVEGPVAGVSRRSLIVKLGAGAAAAAALPVVESITAPSPAAALSRRPNPTPTPTKPPHGTPSPTPGPTPAPTPGPTPAPTPGPTPAPTPSPTPTPTCGPWDKSSYSVTSGGGTTDCGALTVTVCNVGDGSATCPVYYEIYRQAPNTPGNPVQSGNMVTSGTIPPLGNGCGVISFAGAVATYGPGDYQVLVYQHPEHPGSGTLAAAQCTNVSVT